MPCRNRPSIQKATPNKINFFVYSKISFLWFNLLCITQFCVIVGLFDSYHHLGSSRVSYTSANGIQNTSKASIRKFHRSQVYIDHSIFLLLKISKF